MKRASLALLMIGHLLSGCGGELPGTADDPASAIVAQSGGPAVHLQRASSWGQSKNGNVWQYGHFEVLVRNLAYAKDVAIHYKGKDGGWRDLQLAYREPAAGDEELWTGFSRLDDNQPGDNRFPVEFAVRYRVAGQTYWDNNGGRNYRVGAWDGPLLGPGVQVLAAHTDGGVNNPMRIGIDTRDQPGPKLLRVHYTEDDWATSLLIHATPTAGSYAMPGENIPATIQSPNAVGVTHWEVSLPRPTRPFKFALAYVVGSATYWDNHYQRNYLFQNDFPNPQHP